MRLTVFKNTVLLFVLIAFSCGNIATSEAGGNASNFSDFSYTSKEVDLDAPIAVGANQTEAYLPLLQGKKIGIVANQTSVIFHKKGYTHLVDSLVALKTNVVKVFAPEHGFRGTADAGEHVKDGIDSKTKLPIISLYGSNKKPSATQLEGLDLVVFDIQDVGARFYTYISTLHYVMEACAEQNIPVLILDRPNPNGHYIDGPILEKEYKSFVGMHPVPVVHGMTIGEYAKMINGEHWLDNGVTCDLAVIPVQNYTHQRSYSLPIAPSPNLPTDKAINLYPSLCFFEGTNVSAGRGTPKPFEIYGSPYLDKSMYTFKFLPQPNAGSKHPKHKGMLCYGENLSDSPNLARLDLNYLINAYQNTIDKPIFFNDFFTKLAGTKTLQKQIEKRHTADEIKKTWVRGLKTYDQMRQPYLLYK
ncbi:exo-beta-N-acetylmuramidase NamZ domain-containing protein [Mangrovimonas sp. DI 80]|uniref:exo-beta-N-acetylmuramidase NamZ family protein n=1 Tax=Mangrovimonas sp. DI 80 TaxID=1779330 RepID=UPI000978875D|nr:DUF1343 domain-containing protein [Mangrovimonas sp. DI 80]OMP31048.1 hypothetical protein BKM32_08225 [Mangrovimonas sp. DI 80]